MQTWIGAVILWDVEYKQYEDSGYFVELDLNTIDDELWKGRVPWS